MNVHQEDKTLFDDLFHYLTGDCKKDQNGKHLFYLYNLENGHYAFYESDGYILLDDPAIDSSFKYLFLHNPIRLKNFLNDIYFKPNNMEIIELEYMIGEISEIGKRYILEINICELLDEMKRNKDVKLFNKNITRDGADWLKLIGLRFWAKKKEGSLGQYIFPKIKKNELFSKNHYINETILELIKGGDLDINGFSQLEEEFSKNCQIFYDKGFEYATKKNQLDNVYIHLLKGAKDLLQYFPIDYKYTKDEINDIMFKRTSIRIDILQEVFNYLKERGCLITEQKK